MASSSCPTISVVLPNHNHGHLIGNALEAICTQDPPPCDVLILEDCSTDNSVEVIQTFMNRFPFIRMIRYPEKTVDWNHAWCDNLPRAKGDFILSTAADDLIFPGYFRQVGDVLAKHPDVGAVFTDFQFFNDVQGVWGGARSGFPGPTYLSRDQVIAEICRPGRTFWETGVASVIRKEAFLWAIANEAKGLGPWLDSTVWAVAAAKHGACYIPTFLGGLRCGHNPQSYSVGVNRNEKKATEAFQQVVKFLRRPEVSSLVPPQMANVLEQKALGCIDPSANKPALAIYAMTHARECKEAGQKEQAEQYLRFLANHHPHHVEGLSAWGAVLYELGRVVEAEIAFRRIIDIDPKNVMAHSNWGVCLQARGLPDQAVAAYQRAVELDSSFANGFLRLGNLQMALGRHQDALRSLETAAKLNPQSSAGLVSLAKTLLALGKPEGALAICRKAVELDPNLADARATLDQVLSKLK